MTSMIQRALRASAIAAAALALVPAAAAADSYTNDIYTVNADESEFGALTGAAHPAGPWLQLTYQGTGGYNIVHSYSSGVTYDLTDESANVSTLANGVRSEFSLP